MRIPKIIACDLDGTVLLNGARTASPQLLEQIRRLRERGILFMVASGRQYASERMVFGPAVADDLVYMSENGGLCYYNDEILFQYEFERGLALEIIDAVLAQEGCEILISVPGVQYVCPKDPAFYTHMTEVVGGNLQKIRDPHAITEPFIKLAVFNFSGDTRRAYFEKLLHGRCMLQTSGNAWLDFLQPGLHKGRGMQELLKRLGIDPEDCMAFGDNENDTEMLQLVGCPITMETSNPTMIHLGKYRTDTVEHALERILDGEGYDW
ncbi:MAG: HAD family hydrolase [Lachnospiraceae bacterium]|nr:HAD family hydrolase [Lachnospiraceae bacterium]